MIVYQYFLTVGLYFLSISRSNISRTVVCAHLKNSVIFLSNISRAVVCAHLVQKNRKYLRVHFFLRFYFIQRKRGIPSDDSDEEEEEGKSKGESAIKEEDDDVKFDEESDSESTDEDAVSFCFF